MTEHGPSLEDVLKRHKAFWNCSDVDRPLLGVAPYAPWAPPPPYRLRDGSVASDGMKIEPGMVDLKAQTEASKLQQQKQSPRILSMMLDLVQALTDGRDLSMVDGDYVLCWGPHNFPWMEAILGCPVFHENGTCWAKALEKDWKVLRDSGGWRESPWIGEMLEVERLLFEITKGRIGVGQPLFRGPFDMATTAVGASEFCTLVMVQLQEACDLMSYCTDLYIDVAKQYVQQAPVFHDGYFCYAPWSLWAPGTTVRYQSDNSYLVSPDMYREHFMRFDREIARSFEYSAMATHTNQADHLPVYAEIPELRMIEITFEAPPFGRPPLDLLPQFKEVQAKGKALLLTGSLTQKELDGLIEELSPKGLGLWVSIREEEQE